MESSDIDSSNSQLFLNEKIEQVKLISLALIFFQYGCTSFGGMWATTQKLEQELVLRRNWLDSHELEAMLIAATLIPSPKFIGFAGLVGYKLRGWLGSMISVIALFAPGSLLVLLGAIFISPELLTGSLAPLREAMGVSVIGLLIGNALHQLKIKKKPDRRTLIGISLTILVAGLSLAGFPLLLSSLCGFFIGSILLKEEMEE